MVLIQWDSEKAASNFKKHGVTFDEAASVLLDKKSLEYYDTNHSIKEDRFWIIGRSWENRILLVTYSFRRSENVKKEYYRIISARIANKKESARYKKES